MISALEQVTFFYGQKAVLREVSWQLPPCGVVCLWGASGCGKTTLLRLLAGLEHPAAGRVKRPERTAVLFQEDRLLPWRTVLDNVTIAAGVTPSVALSLLTQLGLGGETACFPPSLSGGQRRRVALARALAAEAELLLLDEPFTGMDEAAWRAAVPLIAARAETIPVVLVTHAAAEAQAFGAAMVPLADPPLTGMLSVGAVPSGSSAGEASETPGSPF